MNDPGHGRKRLTFHSMPPGKERKELAKKIEEQRVHEFLDGWKYYNRWIEH